MRQQMSIIRETAKRGQLLAAHLLKPGDVFCPSLAAYKQRKSCRVVANEMREVHGSYRGHIDYTEAPHHAKAPVKQLKQPHKEIVFIKGEE